MKVIIKNPGEPIGHYEEIENDLHALQRKVGGYVEAVTITPDLVMLCEEFTDVTTDLETWELYLLMWGNKTEEEMK